MDLRKQLNLIKKFVNLISSELTQKYSYLVEKI